MARLASVRALTQVRPHARESLRISGLIRQLVAQLRQLRRQAGANGGGPERQRAHVAVPCRHVQVPSRDAAGVGQGGRCAAHRAAAKLRLAAAHP